MPDPNTTPLTESQLELLLQRAAERGAKKALADVGLDGDYAESDIRDLRTLLRALNLAKKTAWQTVIRVFNGWNVDRIDGGYCD